MSSGIYKQAPNTSSPKTANTAITADTQYAANTANLSSPTSRSTPTSSTSSTAMTDTSLTATSQNLATPTNNTSYSKDRCGKFGRLSVAAVPALNLPRLEPIAVIATHALTERSVQQECALAQRVTPPKPYTGFITRDELEKKIKRQQDEHNLDFPGIRATPSAYKAVLSGLENYHRSVKPICPRTKEDAVLHLSLMKKQLDILAHSVFIYNSGWPHGNKLDMRQLQFLIEKEDAKLNTLTLQLKNGDQLPPDMTLTEAMALTQQRVMVKDFLLANSKPEEKPSANETAAQTHAERSAQITAKSKEEKHIREKNLLAALRDFV